MTGQTHGSPRLRDNVARSTAPHPGLTRLLNLYLLAVSLWLVILGIFNFEHPSDWAMGDWLINYSGGFVRRGLIGELALRLTALRISPLLTVLLLQWALYAIILIAIGHLIQRLRWRWWSLAFLLSPATLAFALLDPPFAFRKEILFFALLALTLEGVPPKLSKSAAIVLLALGCGVCILAHEALIVFFPYLFAALYLRTRSLRQASTLFALPACLSLALFALVSHFPGDAHVAQAVCNSIGGQITSPPSGICGGAIDYLAHNATYAHGQVLQLVQADHYWTLIPWLFLLPLLPAALGLRQLWRANPTSARILVLTSAAAWILSLSLFYYGTDWTRWIYIHTFSLMLLMLYAQKQQTSVTPSVLFQTKNSARWLALATLLLYCLGWELSVYGQRPLYGSFLRFVTHNMARGTQ